MLAAYLVTEEPVVHMLRMVAAYLFTEEPLERDNESVPIMCSFQKKTFFDMFLIGLWPPCVFPPPAPKVCQLEGNMCEVSWEGVSPMRGDPISYTLQVLIGRELEYKQVSVSKDRLDIAVFYLFLPIFSNLINKQTN